MSEGGSVLIGSSVSTDVYLASNCPNTSYSTSSLLFDTCSHTRDGGHAWSLIGFGIPSTATSLIGASLAIYMYNTGSPSILHEMIVVWDASSTFPGFGMTGAGKGSTGVWISTAVPCVPGSGTPLALFATLLLLLILLFLLLLLQLAKAAIQCIPSPPEVTV
ncbi:unnamed protein product [Prorocentrum cordatum]|uniref:Subtilisin n=1 Tax=Prorocentrum cordatum TaxID=2364126 RepID=A0ABN9PC95_9DINO|nr:unnamed protein product [Polarella glacialis]